MFYQLCSSLRPPKDNTKHTARKTCFFKNLRELKRGKRSQFRRFKDHRVSACKCRCCLPTCDLKRIVPGADPCAHAQRLPPCIHKACPKIEMLTMESRSD